MTTTRFTVSIFGIKIRGEKNRSFTVVEIPYEDIVNNLNHLDQIPEKAFQFQNYRSNANKIINVKESLVRGLSRYKFAMPFSLTIKSDCTYLNVKYSIKIEESENRGIKEAPKPLNIQNTPPDCLFLYFLPNSNPIYEYNEFVEYEKTYNEFDKTRKIKNEICVSKLARSCYSAEHNPFTGLFPFNQSNPFVIRAPSKTKSKKENGTTQEKGATQEEGATQQFNTAPRNEKPQNKGRRQRVNKNKNNNNNNNNNNENNTDNNNNNNNNKKKNTSSKGIRKGNSLYGRLEIFSKNKEGNEKIHSERNLTIALSSALNENRKDRRPKIQNSFTQMDFTFTIDDNDDISDNTFFIRFKENDSYYASMFKGSKKKSPANIQEF